MPQTPTRRALVVAEHALLGVVLSVALLTILGVASGGSPFLPMNDAPSHIANAVLTHRLWHHDGFFAQHYLMQSTPLPYWAVALLMQPLLLLASPLLAFALLVAAYALLLPVAFALLLPRDAQGRASRVLLPLTVLLAFNWSYFYGEANFFLGQPLALLTYAVFLRLAPADSSRRPWPLLVAFTLLCASVYLCHIYALVALGGMLGGYGLWRLWTRQRPLLSLQQWLAVGVWLLLFVTAAYFVLFSHGSGRNSGGTWAFDWSLRRLLHVFVDPLDSASSPSRVVLLGAVALLLALLVGPHLLQLRQSAQASPSPSSSPGWRAYLDALLRACYPPLLVPGVLLLLGAYLGPQALLNADGTVKEGEIAMRLSLCGFVLLLGGVRLAPQRWVRPALLGVLLGLCAFKLQDTVRLHRSQGQKTQAVASQLLAQVPPHSRLLPLMDFPEGEATAIDYLSHRLGNYVVVLRDGYSPHVFAALGQQPLRHLRYGDHRGVDNLQVTADEWAYFDYVLIQTRRAQPQVPGLTDHAQKVGQTGDFQLYRVRH